MLTTEPNKEMLDQWKRVYEIYRPMMAPNRKSGNEVDKYFREKYPYELFENSKFKEIVSLNITENDFFRHKLSDGTNPDIKSYQTGNVFVGIDLCTGEFHVEGENIDEVIPIYDDLFVYRGLDEEDLKNFFLVAEYVKLTKNLLCLEMLF